MTTTERISARGSNQANYRPEFVTYERIPEIEAVHVLQENIHEIAGMLTRRGVQVSTSPATISPSAPATLTITNGEQTTVVEVGQVLVYDEFGYHDTDQATFYREWRRKKS